MTNQTATQPDQLREIDAERCRHLLGAVAYGRLATVDAGEPVLAVVNHVVDAGDIYLRTRRDSRLARLTEGGRSARAVFEVDSAFPSGGVGWSVMARGRLTREHGASRAAALRERLVAWAQGDRDVVLHLEIAELTGRSVGPA
jgi:nitroimidazol reductase NimA-like FMN-containing flavoprotein (pyridoxamine 5'-phosphate oxidase superfamily)